jgi:hypothetical protein
MWELNSTKPLLDQLKVEEDAEVRQGLFTTLGTVCYYASLPTSTVKVPDEVRKETLELALSFLNQADPARIRSGADVIRKLLEQDGLSPEDVSRYLNALAERYRQVSPTVNHGLRGELLGAMAGLCVQRSVYRAEAAKLYGPVFEQALSDEQDGVRQSAVDGLINTDKGMALRRLRADFADDPNPAIRARLVDLAGEVGGPEDLGWLSRKIDREAEGEPAWQATLKIFRRSDWEVVAGWLTRFEGPDAEIKLSLERQIALLTVAEQRASGENKTDKVKEIWVRLFGLYAIGDQTAQATPYLDRLLADAKDDSERIAVATGLLDTCLRPSPPRLDLTGQVVERLLAVRDLEPEDTITQSINAYLNKPPEGGDPNGLLDRLRQVQVAEPEQRTSWRRLLAQWESYAKGQRAAGTASVSN